MSGKDEIKSLQREISAVIFDMDGVIVDSETVNYHAMIKTLSPYGIGFDMKYYSQFPGGSCIEAYNKVKADFGGDFSVDEMIGLFNRTRVEIANENGWPPVKNAVDTVRYCANKYKIALASGSNIDIIHSVTAEFKIDSLFGSMISGESIEHCKPAPDIFLKSAENIGILPRNCAVIEDSHNGVLAAAAAGMLCIGFRNPNSGNQDLSAADFIIDDMAAVKDIL